MSTQRTNQKIPEHDVELRLRTMRTIWLALFMSIGVYFVLTVVLERSQDAGPSSTLSVALIVVAISATLASLLIKSKLVSRAIDQQRPSLVQQGYIAAWAINEVGALLGLLDFFATGNRYYYLPFVISVIGHLLQFPRREHVENAAMKRPVF